MDPISILEQWVSPITEPLREFRAQIESLANIHYRSANTFQNLINDLTNPGAADSFKGKGADAASSLAETYTSGEMKIASNVTAAAPLAMAIVASTDAVAEIGGAVTEAASEVTDSEPLNEIVEVVDVTTIAQGGADVPEDIVAGGVTLARGISLLTIFLQFVTTLFFIWRSWDGSLYTAAHQAYPPLPGDPSKTVINPQNLSPLEKERLQNIKRALAGTQFSTSEILDLMKEGYTDEEIIAIIKARRFLAKDNKQDDTFTYNDDYLKALAKKGLDATYLQKAVMAGESAGITLDLTATEIMQKIDDLDSRINEDEKSFSVNEKSAAYYLSSQGFTVISQVESTTPGQRRADTRVIAPDGKTYNIEIKTISTPNPPAQANSVMNAIKSAIKRGGQADHILIDGRAKGLTEEQADVGVDEKLSDLEARHVKEVRVLGAGFDKIYIIPEDN